MAGKYKLPTIPGTAHCYPRVVSWKVAVYARSADIIAVIIRLESSILFGAEQNTWFYVDCETAQAILDILEEEIESAG